MAIPLPPHVHTPSYAPPYPPPDHCFTHPSPTLLSILCDPHTTDSTRPLAHSAPLKAIHHMTTCGRPLTLIVPMPADTELEANLPADIHPNWCTYDFIAPFSLSSFTGHQQQPQPIRLWYFSYSPTQKPILPPLYFWAHVRTQLSPLLRKARTHFSPPLFHHSVDFALDELSAEAQSHNDIFLRLWREEVEN